MKRFPHLMLCATLACCAAAAQAGTTVKAAELPQITNGGTGFVGVTESAGMPHQPVRVLWTASSTSPVPTRAGEASTFVDGRPNAQPNAPMGMDSMAATGDRMRGELRAMGSAGTGAMSDVPAGSHMGWGTPD